MGIVDSVRALFGGSAEKATEAATKAAATASSAAGTAKASTTGLTETVKGAAGTAAVTAVTAAGQAKEAVTGVADAHGDKVTGAAAAAHAFVSDKTGGRLDPVTGTLEALTGMAVGALQSGSPASSPARAAPSTPPPAEDLDQDVSDAVEEGMPDPGGD